MNITLHNCEAVFLDYYEKRLSPVEVAEVLFFLEENPAMKEVFEGYGAIFLKQEEVEFPGKDFLKKKHNPGELEAILSSEINRTNCEQFFVACAEGILTETQTRQLYSFLEHHPELKKDFELFQKCRLSAENISLEDKGLLKKGLIQIQNREQYFVRAIEEELNAEEQEQLSAFLKKNPSYKKEFELFKKTILVPEKIPFEFKVQLKKKERKPVFVSIFSRQPRVYYAAAAVLLLAGLFFFFQNEYTTTAYFADTTNPAKNKTVNLTSGKEKSTFTQDSQKTIAGKKETIYNKEDWGSAKKNSSANKNLTAMQSNAKEEKIIYQPVLTDSQPDEALLAKQAEEKKQEILENTVVAENAETKTDSAVTAAAQIETSAVAASPKKSANEYQTVASIVNKKLRSILGIKKSTPCETSDKIGLWDLAMAAKNGVQKATGKKVLDVNKVCDGTHEKVEYTFAAGNFEISKNASR